MIIKVLGPGCKNCKKLEANTRAALKELEIEASIEKVESMEEIMAYGIMSTPALVVDEEVKFAGKIPSVKELKKYLHS
ncbi:thioredoxin family protein [Acetobacterium carbinolicum]|jgi:small redox-active disulfide protein 2|uniref:thioredoxin family protein n=1 Tax=Acetobacterium TaxID=33951 RepID=UPI000DBEC84B|nr:thioredoxin family protein [Acetobacterium sp. KB-1]AWW25193.1 thioredoxin family protein [Acetobacterium sp. KB-1]